MNKTIQSMLMAGVLMMGFGMPSSAQAESVLMHIPYGIEFGQKLSAKLKRLAAKSERNGDRGREYYFAGKFNVYTDNDGLVIRLYFGHHDDSAHKLPKKWREMGLKICSQSKQGTSKKVFLAIVKREGAKHIEWDKSGHYWDHLKFELGGKYAYDIYFKTKRYDSSNCLDGLRAININGDALGEDY